MNEPGSFGMALGSSFSVSAAGFIIVAVLSISEHRLRRLTSFLVSMAMGALFGDVALHLLPEVFRHPESSQTSSLGLLGGLGCSFILEKFLRWKHEHGFEALPLPDETPAPAHSHAHTHSHAHHHHGIKPVARILMISDGLHNVLDGLLIGASFLASRPIGLATTLAVLLHEIPHEIGDLGVLLDAGYSRKEALLFNFSWGAFALIGVCVAYSVGHHITEFTPLALSITAGFFLYIAGSNLTPEMQKENSPRKSATQLLGIFIGVGIMAILLRAER
jgi:zinc and cadmium transporter